jgi:hypothetical protein
MYKYMTIFIIQFISKFHIQVVYPSLKKNMCELCKVIQ